MDTVSNALYAIAAYIMTPLAKINADNQPDWEYLTWVKLHTAHPAGSLFGAAYRLVIDSMYIDDEDDLIVDYAWHYHPTKGLVIDVQGHRGDKKYTLRRKTGTNPLRAMFPKGPHSQHGLNQMMWQDMQNQAYRHIGYTDFCLLTDYTNGSLTHKQYETAEAKLHKLNHDLTKALGATAIICQQSAGRYPY